MVEWRYTENLSTYRYIHLELPVKKREIVSKQRRKEQ